MSTSWYRKSVWSDYHFDMNVQVAAWPLWAANHDEEFLSTAAPAGGEPAADPPLCSS